MELEKKNIPVIGTKIVARKDTEEIGHAYLYLIHNDLHDEPYGLMEDIFVEKEHRGKGIGTKLVHEVVAQARAHKCYKLLAQSRYEREKVHGLYKKFGFQDHGKNFRMNLIESKVDQRD
ncbi:MAG: GNAT family N-acetyltransferase [Candidatus Magasanikbacteria bacterium]